MRLIQRKWYLTILTIAASPKPDACTGVAFYPHFRQVHYALLSSERRCFLQKECSAAVCVSALSASANLHHAEGWGVTVPPSDSSSPTQKAASSWAFQKDGDFCLRVQEDILETYFQLRTTSFFFFFWKMQNVICLIGSFTQGLETLMITLEKNAGQITE